MPLWKPNASSQSQGNQSSVFIGRTDAEALSNTLAKDAKSWLIGKDRNAGKDWRQEEKGTTEDEMVGWHHWLNGHEFEQAPGVGDAQGSLVLTVHGVTKSQTRLSDWTEESWMQWWLHDLTFLKTHMYTHRVTIWKLKIKGEKTPNDGLI